MGEVLRLVEGRFLEEVRAAHLGVWEQHDPKTTLQERAAALGLPHPSYELLGRSGPDHAPRFRMRVQVGPHQAEAEDGTRRRAEAQAAASLLRQLLPK
jgi:ribonuclease-3